MTQPDEHIFRAIALGPARNGGTVDHQDRQAQIPCGDQLGVGAVPASVLAHHQIDGVGLHQLAVACGGEWSAINDQAVMGQAGRLLWRIDEAQQIMMLRLGGEGSHMHPSQRQHDAAGLPRERRHCAVDVGNAGPAVTGDWLPRPTGQRHMGHPSQTGCFHGMDAHHRGKGVGRVNQMGHPMVAQIVRQPDHAAEPANAHWHQLSAGIFCSPGIAERRRDALRHKQTGERGRFGRATQQEDIRHG